MIKILMGEKGTGKTKVLTDMVNKAASVADGMVVCINKGNRLMHDVDIGVRLVDTEEFNITNPDVFLGFIEGIISQNFDITQIYIDGILNNCRLTGIGTFQFQGGQLLKINEQYMGYSIVYNAIHGSDDEIPQEGW